MKPSYKQLWCIVLFVLPITMHCWVTAEPYDDSWMEPDGWSESETCCKCTDLSLPPKYEQLETTAQTGKFSEDGVALLYLRRWLMLLFDRKKLAHDDQRQLARRTLTFSLTQSQLAKIEKWNDVRDLDEVITEVFKKAYENGECYSTKKPTGFLALVRDIFIDFIQMTKISEIRFLLVAALVAMCGWLLHRNYHIPYWTLVTGGLLLYGYFHTYLECNRELEVNEVLESIKSAEKQKSSGFMRFLKNIFYSSDPEEQFKKSSKIKLGFCRPDEVAIMYFTNIFLKYLQILLERGAGIIDILNGQLSFPYKFLAPVLFVLLICYFIQLTFKYIFRPAVGSYIWQRNSQPQTHHNQNAAIAQGDADTHVADRISGDNLRTLLGLLKPVVEGNTPKEPAVSGAEEVREAIAPAATNDTSTSSNTSETSQSKVNKNSKALKDKVSPYNNVDIEDLPDER